MPVNPYGKSMSDWVPKVPTGKNEKLLRPNAHDAKDTMTGTNELKGFRGKSGKPDGPLGKKGHEF